MLSYLLPSVFSTPAAETSKSEEAAATTKVDADFIILGSETDIDDAVQKKFAEREKEEKARTEQFKLEKEELERKIADATKNSASAKLLVELEKQKTAAIENEFNAKISLLEQKLSAESKKCERLELQKEMIERKFTRVAKEKESQENKVAEFKEKLLAAEKAKESSEKANLELKVQYAAKERLVSASDKIIKELRVQLSEAKTDCEKYKSQFAASEGARARLVHENASLTKMLAAHESDPDKVYPITSPGELFDELSTTSSSTPKLFKHAIPAPKTIVGRQIGPLEKDKAGEYKRR